MSNLVHERIPVRITIDYACGFVEVESSDGQVTREPLLAAAPSDEVVRSDFDPTSGELTVTLAWGAQAIAEISHDAADADRGGRPVVYLDQNHWVGLARHQWAPEKIPGPHRDAYARLFAMGRERRIILPISAAHLVETGHSNGPWRRDLATTMLQLSRGWQMRSPLKVRHYELVAAMAGERSVEAPPVFTLEPQALFAPEGAAVDGGGMSAGFATRPWSLHSRLTWASSLIAVLVEDKIDDDADAAAKVERWRSGYERLATYMGDAGTPKEHVRLSALAAVLADLSDEVARAAVTAGLSQEYFEKWIADAEKHFPQMAYLGRLQDLTYRRLRNARERWQANDLNDMHALSCAAGYADVVIGEKHTSTHLRRANTNVASGAFVSSSPAEAVDHLDAALA